MEEFSLSPTADASPIDLESRAKLIKTPYGGKAVDFGDQDTQSLLSD